MDTGSQEILKLLYISIFSILAWNATVLWARARITHLFNRYLSLFIWVMLTPFLLAYSTLAFPAMTEILIIPVSSFIWLYGPFLLLFVRVVLKSRNAGHPLWHAVPFIVVLTAFTVGDFLPASILSTLPIVGLVHAAGYTLVSLKQLIANKLQIYNLVTEYRYSTYYWLLFVIVGLLFLIAYDSYIHVNARLDKMPNTAIWNGLLLLVGLYLIGVSTVSIHFSRQRHGDPAGEGAQSKNDSREQPPPLASPRRLRELNESTANILAETLETSMREDKVYLNNDLSMSSLGRILGVTNHQLSELLNVHLNSSFYSYVNEFRLQEAVELLERPGNNAAIADIAYQAGFNSKNSFYKAFRERYGYTPHTYRKNTRALPAG